MAQVTEADLVKSRVDRHPHVDVASEADEDQVLAELYGPADELGIYRGGQVLDPPLPDQEA